MDKITWIYVFWVRFPQISVRYRVKLLLLELNNIDIAAYGNNIPITRDVDDQLEILPPTLAGTIAQSPE